MPDSATVRGRRVLVVGCGSIGRRHLANLRALGVEEIAVFDRCQERLARVATEYRVTPLARLEQAWAHPPDATFITTPTGSHIPVALEAARCGSDLFIEKPLSHTLDGVSDLVDLAHARSLVTLVGCNMRFHPGPARIKRVVDDGLLGALLSARLVTGSYLPTWRPQDDYRRTYSASAADGGGAVLDCIHEIDLALWYLGAGRVVAAVIKPADTLGLTVEGLAEILIQHEAGAVSSVHLNFVQRDYRRSCELIGADGSLYWSFTEARVRVHRHDGERTEFEQPPGWTVNQMYVDEIAHFLDCLDGRTATINEVERAARTLQVALAAKALGKGATESVGTAS